MDKFIFTLAFLILATFSYGQSDSTGTNITGPSFIEDSNPTMIIVIESEEFIIDDKKSLSKLKPSWIKKIEVFNQGVYVERYKNKDGVVLIYPKKKKISLVKEVLEID